MTALRQSVHISRRLAFHPQALEVALVVAAFAVVAYSISTLSSLPAQLIGWVLAYRCFIETYRGIDETTRMRRVTWGACSTALLAAVVGTIWWMLRTGF